MEWFSRFEFGSIVQRKNKQDGSEPPYRFKGDVCGSYKNPKTGERGAAVCSHAEQGCIQIFPDYILELATPPHKSEPVEKDATHAEPH